MADLNVIADQGNGDGGSRVHDLPLLDQVNARSPVAGVVLSWREGVPMRLSDLIRERVALEWHRRGDPTLRPLVDPAWEQAGLEEAMALALRGFERNAFLVIVDDVQLTELEAELRLTPATTIIFVRLMPLVGG